MANTYFQPTKLPTQRLKLTRTGIIGNKWTITDETHYQLYTAVPSYDQVELKSSYGLTSIVSLPTSPMNEDQFKEIQFQPILLQPQPRNPKWVSRLRTKHLVRPTRVALKINFGSMFRLDFTYSIPFDVTCGDESIHFEIKNICEFFQWRGWEIYSRNDPHRPLLRFVWFGTNTKHNNGPIAGIEFYSQFPISLSQALVTVALAFFTECHKMESPPPPSPISSPRSSHFLIPFNLPFVSSSSS